MEDREERIWEMCDSGCLYLYCLKGKKETKGKELNSHSIPNYIVYFFMFPILRERRIMEEDERKIMEEVVKVGVRWCVI